MLFAIGQEQHAGLAQKQAWLLNSPSSRGAPHGVKINCAAQQEARRTTDIQ